jgi:CMP-N-acetylneuraminic acid synthetase
VRILGLIPARGGSRGVPHKNVRLLGGKPLLAYTAEAALGARRLTRVVLSTEDPDIAVLGKRLGLDVPFARPAELAGHETPMLPVVQHAMRWLEERGERYDAVCLLQPTNPARPARLIDACLAAFAVSDADALVTTLPVPAHYNPHWVFFADRDGILRPATGDARIVPRRQELPPAYHRDGSVYVTRRNVVLSGNSLYGARLVGYPVDPSVSVNVDTWGDWRRAERLLARRRGGRAVKGAR